jgi:saccharopine dehydrogenase-like NADP-dependent oxidoreductase
MKEILLFGAGKSATVLIDYLLDLASREEWRLTVADANLELAQSKIGTSTYGKAVSFDIRNEPERSACIGKADIVLSLLPPALHLLVAQDCILFKKNLLTASYVDESMKALSEQIKSNGLLFLCEMGLDPGIDHMSAKRLADDIRANGGTITSFYSHCGGLVAPDSDDNPWHYKISWNPRNVVMAGKAGAVFKKEGELVELDYKELFAERRYVSIPDHEALCWYPNRDSLSYLSLYGLQNCETFVRTTLRHPDFMYGWKNVIDLKLTDETPAYDTDGKTLAAVFKEHMDAHDFGPWLEQKLQEQFGATRKLLEELINLTEMETKAAQSGIKPAEEFMVVDGSGDLQAMDIDDLKLNAATVLADKMHDAKLTLKQLFFLGIDDNETVMNKGRCSAADLLQFSLEHKLALKQGDKDLVIMLHDMEYTDGGEKFKATSTLVLEGRDDHHTAMATTVGLPLGIAAKLILKGMLKLEGLHIPIIPDIYLPVLEELEANGIRFVENTVKIS